jgi:hypothetical protein
MTLRELIQGIKDNTIEVDFDRGWIDFKHPKKYLIKTLEEALGRLTRYSESKKDIFSKIGEVFSRKEYDELEIGEDNSLHYGMMNMLKHHSFILSTETYICLENNKICFKVYDNNKDWKNNKLVPLQIEEGIETPLTTTIQVPSKKLILANFFPDSISPDIVDPYSAKNSLCGLVGRRNHARHYENCGVLYGQTTNTGLIVWVNKTNTEIIITESYLDEIYVTDPEDFETTEDWQEYVKDNVEEIKICNWLKENEFQQAGSGYRGSNISCSVWRFEATDFERGKEIIDLKKNKVDNWEYRDIVVVPIAGDEVQMEHYFDSIEKSPISKLIVSKITVK